MGCLPSFVHVVDGMTAALACSAYFMACMCVDCMTGCEWALFCSCRGVVEHISRIVLPGGKDYIALV